MCYLVPVETEFSAHKLVLAACSEYLDTILKKDRGPSTSLVLCLENMNSKEVTNLLDYIYKGEVQLEENDLERFLTIANNFKLDGLTGFNDTVNLQQNMEKENMKGEFMTFDNLKSWTEGLNYFPSDDKKEINLPNQTVRRKSDIVIPILESSFYGNMDELDEEIRGKTFKTEKGLFACKVCDRIFKSSSHVKEHVETHIGGITFLCPACNHSCRSRHAFRNHFRQNHRNINKSLN